MNSTDQAAGSIPVQAEDPRVTAGRVLAAVAKHLTDTRPDDELNDSDLLVCVAAETYKFGGRNSGTGPAVSRAAMTAAPERRPGVTRGEYALLLRKAATACGYDWTGDDNERAIPPVPRPRTEPESKEQTVGGRA
jgi:hypothetical protein